MGHSHFPGFFKGEVEAIVNLLAVAVANAIVKHAPTIDEATKVIEAAGLHVNNITEADNANFLALKAKVDKVLVVATTEKAMAGTYGFKTISPCIGEIKPAGPARIPRHGDRTT